MNEPIRKSKTSTITNLFAIICILIVCYVGVVSSKQFTPINWTPEQIPNQSGSNQAKSGKSEALKERWQTKQDATRRNPIPTRNSSLQNSTGWKPMGSLQTVYSTGIVTKVFIKDWQLAYTKVEAVVNSGAITRHILWACIKTRNQPHCVSTLLGIAKAESSIFRRCYKWSCLGIKPKGSIKTYDNVKYGIDDWVERYNKYWYNNKNADDMLRRSLYCDGECEQRGSNWRLSFDSFIWYIK